MAGKGDLKGTARTAGKTALWPFRRFFDPRFEAGRSQTVDTDLRLHAKLDEVIGEVRGAGQRAEVRVEALGDGVQHMLADATQSVGESAAHVGVELDRLAGSVDAIEASLSALRERLKEELGAYAFHRGVGSDLAEMDGDMAAFLNYAESHRGLLAQAGLWLNPPVSVEYVEGAVRVGNVNERIVEIPWVFAALAGLPPGSSVLDVGASESSVLSLASLGMRGTALDLREHPFAHPLLASAATPLEEWDAAAAPFDAVVCLSSIEHFGLGAYGEDEGEPDADVRAMERLRGLAREGATLVLTVPYGRAGRDERQRIYDRPALDRLLGAWQVTEVRIVAQADAVTWVAQDGDEVEPGRAAVALVTAVAGGPAEG